MSGKNTASDEVRAQAGQELIQFMHELGQALSIIGMGVEASKTCILKDDKTQAIAGLDAVIASIHGCLDDMIVQMEQNVNLFNIKHKSILGTVFADDPEAAESFANKVMGSVPDYLESMTEEQQADFKDYMLGRGKYKEDN